MSVDDKVTVSFVGAAPTCASCQETHTAYISTLDGVQSNFFDEPIEGEDGQLITKELIFSTTCPMTGAPIEVVWQTIFIKAQAAFHPQSILNFTRLSKSDE